MPLRPLTPAEGEAAADFLDSRTLVLRWFVAFLRHVDLLPEEARATWSLWCDGPPGLARIAAHSFHNGTTYVAAAEGADLREVESLCRTEFLSERLVGDRAVMEAWRGASGEFFEKAARVVETEVLAFDAAAAPAARKEAGFRLASADDRARLEAYERLYCLESGEDLVSDFDSLIRGRLVYVWETGGRIAGMIRSNLSDGRFVHAGGLYVLPDERGRGVGRGLALGLAREVERAMGAVALIDCDARNESALRAYRAAGYRKVGEGLEAHFPEEAWRQG